MHWMQECISACITQQKCISARIQDQNTDRYMQICTGWMSANAHFPQNDCYITYITSIIIWNPDTWYETLQKYMYRYIPCIYQYMSVQESCTDMYSVCTSTWFLYWYVHGMYFTLFCNASMYQYVLAKDRTVFSRYDVVTQSWNVTEYLSVAHNSISGSSISKNTVFTGGSIYLVYTWYVQSTYQRYTCAKWYKHVPNTLHFQSSLS